MQRLRELARLVEAVFDELEQSFGAYQLRSGLNCIPGCGACCNNPNIEATVLEMLPLALRLYDLGQAETVLEELQGYSGFACYHYKRSSLDGLMGSCSVYKQRPVICRVFGAAGDRDKYGNARLSVCRQIKLYKPEAYQVAVHNLSLDTPPRMATGKQRLRQLDFTLGKEDLPINQALEAALRRVLFQSSFSDPESAGQIA
jgi:Fe-S-cluster containining protein